MSTATSTVVFTTPTANGSVVSLKPISDLLQAMVTAGKLVQTADTGQVSWGGVAANQTSTNNYEIFYLNDSLHSTAPIYMKFVYATQVTANVPKCSFQIGTSTDGAGNLTGLVSAAVFFRGNGTTSSQDTNAQSIWVSAGSGYLNIWGGFSPTALTSSSGGFGLSIERLRDSSGAITVDGITVNYTNAWTTSAANMYLASAGGLSAASSSMQPQSFMMGSYSAIRSQIPGIFNTSNWVWPQIMSRGGVFYNNPQFDGTNFVATACQPFAGKIYPPGIAYVIADTNFPALSLTLSMTIYSVSHNYATANLNMIAPIATGSVSVPGNLQPPSPNSGAAYACFLYE